MTFTEALHSHLAGHAGLVALVGTRVRLGRAFQETLRPFVVYESLTETRPHSHSTANVGLVCERWQFNIYSADPASGWAVKKQLRLALRSFPGSTGYAGPQFILEGGPEGYVGEPPAEYELIMTGMVWRPED